MKFGNPKGMTVEQRDEVRKTLHEMFVGAIDGIDYDGVEVVYDDELGEWTYEASNTTYYRGSTWTDPAESAGETYYISGVGMFYSRRWKCLVWKDLVVTDTGGW
jgi:hypothetical protein